MRIPSVECHSHEIIMETLFRSKDQTIILVFGAPNSNPTTVFLHIWSAVFLNLIFELLQNFITCIRKRNILREHEHYYRGTYFYKSNTILYLRRKYRPCWRFNLFFIPGSFEQINSGIFRYFPSNICSPRSYNRAKVFYKPIRYGMIYIQSISALWSRTLFRALAAVAA